MTILPGVLVLVVIVQIAIIVYLVSRLRHQEYVLVQYRRLALAWYTKHNVASENQEDFIKWRQELKE